jgi:hypothetical protein
MVSNSITSEHDGSAIHLAVRHRGNDNNSARTFGAYFVSFDGKALGVGETIDAAPGVKLTRRC